MATNGTPIEWTDDTWNPVRGCSLVSAGCTNCYAMKQAHRFAGEGGAYEGLTRLTGHGPVWTGAVRLIPEILDQPLRWRKGRRIFVNSMSDLFHEGLSDEDIDRVFAVMALAPQHTFQVLTKRPERMRDYLSSPDRPHRIARAIDVFEVARAVAALREDVRPVCGYPGYFVSNLGAVFTEKRGPRRPMSPDVGEQGHRRVSLYRPDREGVADRVLVHRLVLETFAYPPPSSSHQACHRDGDPANNALPNLRWGTQSDNWADRARHGHARSYTKLTPDEVEEIRHLVACGHPAYSLGLRFGISDTQVRNIARGDQWATTGALPWPLPGVWLGTSIEDQATADERLPLLLQTPAAVRFVSAEPLLGPVDLRRRMRWRFPRGVAANPDGTPFTLPAEGGTRGLDWVIVGGESGPGARPMHPAWAREIRDQCQAAGVAFFFKQWGAWHPVCAMSEEQAEACYPPRGHDRDERTRRPLVPELVQHASGECFELLAPGAFAADTGAMQTMKVGKRRAGRLLDGAEWSEFPS